jgi:hypothetical protein
VIDDSRLVPSRVVVSNRFEAGVSFTSVQLAKFMGP